MPLLYAENCASCVTGQIQGELSPSTAARYASWMGGAVLSKVVFQQGHAIGKFDYDEVGPAVVHRKCC